MLAAFWALLWLVLWQAPSLAADSAPEGAPLNITGLLKPIDQETESLTGLPDEGRTLLLGFELGNPHSVPAAWRLTFDLPVQGPFAFMYGWPRSPWISIASSKRGVDAAMVAGREGFTAEVRLEPKATRTIVLQLTQAAPDAIWRLWQPQAWDDATAQAVLLRGIFAGALVAAAAWLTGLAVLRFHAPPFWGAVTIATGLALLLGQAGLAAMGAGGLLLAGGAFLASLFHFVVVILGLETRSPRLALALDGLAFAIVGFAATGSLGFEMAPGIVAFLAAVGAAVLLGLIVLLVLRGDPMARGIALGGLAVLAVALSPSLLPDSFKSQVAQWPLLLDGGFVMGLLLLAFCATVPRRAAISDEQARKLVVDQKRAREAEHRYALGLAAAHQGLWDWNVETDTLYVSPTVEALLGLPQGSFGHSERAWAQLIHAEDLHVYDDAIASYRVQGNVSFSLEFRMRHTRGELVWVQLKASCFAGRDGRATRCIGVVSDATARRTRDAQDVKDETRDPVTGLTSRSVFLDKLDQVFASLNQAGLSPRGLVLAIDLERVKTINDGMGHAAGDRFLKQVAERILSAIGPVDVLSRIGSDEFACLVLPDDLGKDPNLTVARIKEELARPVTLDRKELFPSASIGAVTLGPQHRQAGDALREAEIAMYHAKRGGRGGFELYNASMKPRSVERMAVDADLRRAIERDELDLFFQPIVYLDDGAIAGFEALIRWRHPTKGLISPGDFIPAAEESGLIVSIGQFVLHRAAAELRRWQTYFPSDPAIFVSVNVSPKQLFRPEFVREVQDVLQKYGPVPGTLKLEITESAMMQNPDQVALVLQGLRGLGAGLALDDFGTGYSSLSYLQRYPFDTIKVDRSFVAGLSGTGDAPVIVGSIVSLARNLRMSVVAEGVESQNEVVKLAQMGCQFAQGFYYGAPMDAAAAYSLMALKGKVGAPTRNQPGSGAAAILR